MWRIHRYYLRELLMTVGLATVVLFGIVLLSVVHRALDRASGFGMLVAARTTMWFALDLAPHVFALALLIGTVLVYGRASHERETTALQAAGIPVRTVLAPALLTGAVLAAVSGFALHYVVPTAHWEKYRLGGFEAVREFVLQTGLREDTFRIGNRFSMTWERRDAQWFRDVTIRVGTGGGTEGSGGESSGRSEHTGRPDQPIVDDGPDLGTAVAAGTDPPPLSASDLSGIYRAERARLVSGIGRGSGLVLLRLEQVRRPTERKFAEHLEFGVDLFDIAGATRRDENERDLRSDQLLAEVLGGRGESPIAAAYVFHRRGCFALLPLVFAPLGFLIGTATGRRGRSTALSLALLPVFAFYLGDALSRSLVAATSNAWLAYTPVVTLAAFAATLGWWQSRR